MKNTIHSIITITLISFSLMLFAQCNANTQKSENMNTTTAKTDSTVKQIIVDVRSVEEWENDGHADCSVNYPLDSFQSKIDELKKYDKVVLVCRSGGRAGVAKSQLQSAGFTKEVENLGAWQNVKCE